MQATPYEQGGVVGPKQKGIIDLLQGAGPASPLPAGPTLSLPGQSPINDLPEPPRDTGTLTGGIPQGGQQTGAPKGNVKDAALGLLQQGTKGKDLTDALRGQGYEDNGLYYGDKDQFGFSNFYLVPDASKPGGYAAIDRAQESPQGPQRQGGMPSFGGSNISEMLQSDAQGNIQQALSSLQQPGMLQQLIAALQGGQ